MKRFFARTAWLADGWAEQVAISTDASGMIVGLQANAVRSQDDTVLAGTVIPGMPNAHSHAFQRAMAGLTQRLHAKADDFWAWRETMYRFLERLTPDELESIASQLYVEMLESGYTSVAEFHYVHHDPLGAAYRLRSETAQRMLNAAARTGIAMTMLPVYYRQGGFDQAATAGQRRFVMPLDHYMQLLDELRPRIAQMGALYSLGIAPHSLRAVPLHELRELSQWRRSQSGTVFHLHAAEQAAEVQACLAATGSRPVELLLAQIGLGEGDCLVHATHLDETEVQGLARSGATVCLCPTTEADLGDGIFPGTAFLAAQGSLAIGGDSHVGTDPFAELRLFEYSQRLSSRRRNRLAVNGEDGVGGSLYRRAAQGGAKALGQPVGELAVGRRADLVVIGEDPALTGLRRDRLIDGLVFGPRRAPITDVYVGARHVVVNGRHEKADGIASRYSQTMESILS